MGIYSLSGGGNKKDVCIFSDHYLLLLQVRFFFVHWLPLTYCHHRRCIYCTFWAVVSFNHFAVWIEMSELCLVCREDLPDDASYLTCSECNYGYHLGLCSGLTKTAFKSKDDAMKKKHGSARRASSQLLVAISLRGVGWEMKKHSKKCSLKWTRSRLSYQYSRAGWMPFFSVKESVDKLEH